MNKEQLNRQIEAEKQRAAEAQVVLSNPLYREAVTALKADLFEKFRRTNWLQAKERTEIWRTLKNLENLERYLTKVITTGKMSK